MVGKNEDLKYVAYANLGYGNYMYHKTQYMISVFESRDDAWEAAKDVVRTFGGTPETEDAIIIKKEEDE